MITGLNHITLAVFDVELSFKFYSQILNFAPVAKWKTGAYLQIDRIWIALIEDGKVSSKVNKDYSHFAFSCSSFDFENIVARIVKFGCEKWSENHSEGKSYYFKDPDGHKLEIHVGDLSSRIEEMKSNPRCEYKFY